ncbi:MAG: hypothetical protein KDI19_12575, partial [Pseudomonadales bacterium]|nr:hypothetical protein [Pseudomonadales bacterium]
MIANTLSAKTILTRPPYILFFLGAHPFQIVGVFLYAVFALPYIVISRDPAACLWHILAIALLTGIRSDALHRSWHAFLIPDYRLTQKLRTLLLALALTLPIVAVVFEPDR